MDDQKLLVPLNPRYLFKDEALTKDQCVGSLSRFVVHREMKTVLKRVEKFLLQEGGCLLLCGAKGTGKTSLINKAIAEIEATGLYEITDSRWVKARPGDVDYLMEDLLEDLVSWLGIRKESLYDLRKWLNMRLNFARGLKEKQSRKILQGIKTKIPGTEIGADFWGEKQTESEINSPPPRIRFTDVRRVARGVDSEKFETRRLFFLHRWGRRLARRLKVVGYNIGNFVWGEKPRKFVFVLDQLDYLEPAGIAGQDDIKLLLTLLRELSVILAESGLPLSIVAIAGVQTYLAWLEEQKFSGRPFAVSQAIYLPCIWEAQEIERILKTAVDHASSAYQAEVQRSLEDLKEFICFRSRGRLIDVHRNIWECVEISRTVPTHRRNDNIVHRIKNRLTPQRLVVTRHLCLESLLINKYAEIQREVQKAIFPLLNTAEPLLRDLQLDEVYRLLADVFELEVGTTIELQEHKYTFNDIRLAEYWDRPRKRAIQFSTTIQATLNLLRKMGYLEEVASMEGKARKEQRTTKYRITKKVWELRGRGLAEHSHVNDLVSSQSKPESEMGLHGDAATEPAPPMLRIAPEDLPSPRALDTILTHSPTLDEIFPDQTDASIAIEPELRFLSEDPSARWIIREMDNAIACPFCGHSVTDEERMHLNVTVCDKCMTPHHIQCWRANGGCTTLGCENNPPRQKDRCDSYQRLIERLS